MKKLSITELQKFTNDELNALLEVHGLNPSVETDEDRQTAINILSQIL